MIPEILRNNLASWIAQVLVIASVGALLPQVFRISHPRTKLAYCHFVLAVCAVLPLIQPWHHARVSADGLVGVLTTSTAIADPSLATPFTVNWEKYVLLILVAGFVARLAWLGVGLLQIRRYRIASTSLVPVPASISMACERVGVSARFCVTSEMTSPATAGHFHPVVLLPESFLKLSDAAQHGIACHELIHVRRRDWLITVVEEVLAAVFWFHPGVWWLLAQTRLSREQLVDAEVVRLTAAREEYVAALLAIAGTRLELDLAPAPLFLRRRHFSQRMHSLLTEVSMSKLRLVSSYAAMGAILSIAVWAISLAFPLQGQAQVVIAPAKPPTAAPVTALAVPATALPAPKVAVELAAGQNPPPPPPPPPSPPPPPPPPPPPSQDDEQPLRVGGDLASRNLVYKVDPAYPPLAREARVEGKVILQATIGKDGYIKDLRVLTQSDPRLLPGVIDAVKQWVYKPSLLNGKPVEVLTTITVSFSLDQ